MAIAPFRACRQSLTSEQLREATESAVKTTSATKSESFPTTKVAAEPDSEPSFYAYDHHRAGSRLRGVVALLEGTSLAQLRCPMPADPAKVQFARNYLSSKREQVTPVLALYDAPVSPKFEAHFAQSTREGHLRVEPISDATLGLDFAAELTDSPLTVISGQEWIAAPDGQTVMVLLVDSRACQVDLDPLHRTLRWKPGWSAGDMVRLGREHFFFHDITQSMPPTGDKGPHYSKSTAHEQLRPRQPGENVYLVVTARHTFRAHSFPGWADTVLANRSPEERAISAVQLHEILLPEGLGMPATVLCDEEVTYTHDTDEAIARVSNGDADVAFLMNAPSVEQIVAVARTGGSVPPHTFRPRLAPVPGAITYAL